MLLLNIIYVLLAIGMIALILMQRGAGAQAGAGFGGGGASGTVFGSRGSGNFLTKSTKWMAIAFFGLSLFMAWQAMRDSRPVAAQDGGLMSEMPAPPAPAGGAVPSAPGVGSTVPVAPTQPSSTVPSAPVRDVAPAAAQPASPAPSTSVPAPPTGG